jgi:signal transduction histidine kinase
MKCEFFIQHLRIVLFAAFCVCTLQTAPFLIAQHERPKVDSLLNRLVQTAPNSETQVLCLLEISATYNTFHPDSTIEYGVRAVKLSQTLGYKYGVAEGTRLTALGYQRIGKLTEATRLYLRALPMFEEIPDSLGYGNTLNGLGISYFEQEDYSNALAYYQRAEPVFFRIGNMNRYSAALSNIGYAYLSLNYLGLAKIYSEKSLALAKKYDVSTIKMFALISFADIYRRERRFDSSAIYLEECRRELKKNPQNYVSISRLHYVWGLFDTDTKNFTRAQKHLDTSLLAAIQGNMRFRMKDAYQGFQKLYEAKQDFVQAYQYQTKVVQYRDSLFNQESARQIAAMQRELEARAQNDRITLLTKDNELQQLQRNALIGFTILVLLVGAVLTYLYSRTQKSNKQLQLQNAEIRKQQYQLSQQSEEIAAINGELQQKNARLIDLNEEKNHFLAIAAHDLKNPLTGIRSLSDYLSQDSISLPESEVHLLGSRISQTADRMFKLVQNLLDVNAIESGKMELQLTEIDIVPIVETITQQYMDAATAKNITLRFNVNLGENSLQSDNVHRGLWAIADENALMQVLDNLISNLVKYSPQGKQAFVRVIQMEKVIKVEIQDEGPGLTDEDKSFLFGKFTKLTARPTGGEHSTGLGLSIVKQLVELMYGSVRCDSEYGNGATFIVELPRAFTRK